jgi:hypothetical protein
MPASARSPLPTSSKLLIPLGPRVGKGIDSGRRSLFSPLGGKLHDFRHGRARVIALDQLR